MLIQVLSEAETWGFLNKGKSPCGSPKATEDFGGVFH